MTRKAQQLTERRRAVGEKNMPITYLITDNNRSIRLVNLCKRDWQDYHSSLHVFLL